MKSNNDEIRRPFSKPKESPKQIKVAPVLPEPKKEKRPCRCLK